jgi:hypothetical protein
VLYGAPNAFRSWPLRASGLCEEQQLHKTGGIKMSKFSELVALFETMPSGPLVGEPRVKVLELLKECWFEFTGSTDSKMEFWKVQRDEGPTDMIWDPPVLTFVVERHGSTVLGSTRAEKQQWNLNLENKTANHCTIGFRQLYSKAPALKVKPIAALVYEAVRQGPDSNSDLISRDILVWKDPHTIVIRHGILIPNDGYQMTISGRRKRFRAELELRMAAIGWELVGLGRSLTFKKVASTDAPTDASRR